MATQFIDEDDTMDETSGFSNTEKYRNYIEIVNTLNYIEDNGRITEDWMEENIWVIEKWRDWVYDYSNIHSEITDIDFRTACTETETVIQYLIKSIRTTKTFNVKVYTILLRKMKYMCDYLLTDSEIEDLMNALSIK